MIYFRRKEHTARYIDFFHQRECVSAICKSLIKFLNTYLFFSLLNHEFGSWRKMFAKFENRKQSFKQIHKLMVLIEIVSLFQVSNNDSSKF